jgi:hypothetical protein
MQELRRVGADAFGKPHGGDMEVDFRVRTGKPAVEILQEARRPQQT